MKRLAILAIAVATLLLASAWSDGSIHADTDHPIRDPATGYMVATRLNPPPPPPVWPTGIYNLPFAPFGLSDCQEMMFYANQFSLPARFEALGFRESNCRNEDGVHTSCCYGYWQLDIATHLSDHRMVQRYANCGVDHYTDVNSDEPLDKQRQACAAKQLYDVVGLSPWG